MSDGAAGRDSGPGSGPDSNSGPHSDRDDRPAWYVARALSTAIARLGRNPLLLAPFALAGFVLAVIDTMRRHDPIPVLEYGGLDRATIHLEYAGYPTATGQTTLPLESLVGIELPYLVWGGGLYVLSLLAVSAAGVLTFTALLDDEAHLGPLPSYFGLVVGFDLGYRLLSSVEFLQNLGLLGIVPLVLILFVLVLLFPAPGLVAAGASPWTAVRRSEDVVRGERWTVLGLVLLLGICAWVLASVPVVGPFLTGALIAPLHAALIVSLFEYRRAGERFWAPSEP
ncbi:hypothetical protein C482_07219 [Natrialba chahannaoensis JCM 10990]|uniref:Uncharacterized protein n=1 Tax=Natrialba chahannaoensis JCM 10990 TaxID=1227492 RepID=M0AS81_9EURY|nr:hypothetical protein [Natrialba chahannaoensis]ELZ01546.1 hypothetical protein C482_07219 [Natrialba chahannaoensis JCM 10990]